MASIRVVMDSREVRPETHALRLPDLDGPVPGSEIHGAARAAQACGRGDQGAALGLAGVGEEAAGSSRVDEERLVKCCLRGDPAAWRILFAGYHPRLVIIIRGLLRGRSDAEQAEEIAAEVWSSICSDGFSRLRRYDPRVGCLLGYLAGMARREIWKGNRSERSRHSRECRAARKEATSDEVDHGLVFDEFLATLTRTEREYCLSELLPQIEKVASSRRSTANGWQLRSRVLKKFKSFFLQKNPR